MRDDVLAKLKEDDGQPGLLDYCHVSGGLVLGAAGWRNEILHNHMPMVLEAFRHGDQELFYLRPELENAQVLVHFVSNHKRFDQTEDWGQIQKYRIAASEEHIQATEELA
jgi:hypothetical protein